MLAVVSESYTVPHSLLSSEPDQKEAMLHHRQVEQWQILAVQQYVTRGPAGCEDDSIADQT